MPAEGALLDLHYAFNGARWYDPSIGRFMQADSIVPEPGNPQSLNRYSYVLNNPMRYTDPTGRIEQNEVDDANAIIEFLRKYYGADFETYFGWAINGNGERYWDPGKWLLSEMQTVRNAIVKLGDAMGGPDRFISNIGPLAIHKFSKGTTSYGDRGYIDFGQQATITEWLVVHETAHAWDAINEWGLSDELLRRTFGKFDASGNYHAGLRPPTTYSPADPRNDWSDSVAAYVLTVDAATQTTINTGNPMIYGIPFHLSYRALIVEEIMAR